MLQHLEIYNVALIDEVKIELGAGLNILTGETGAGKSIIIDSINAILGERVSRDLIRSGKDKATVEAVFQIDNDRLADIYENSGIEPEEDGILIVSREFAVNGKNICRVNGKMVTMSMLKEIGERLIDIHGQHDNQSLLRTESHIELFDSFGGEEIQRLKQVYTGLLINYKEIRSKLKSLSGDKIERARKIDLLNFQIEEIKKAKLRVTEDEELSRQRTLLSNSEKIISALSGAYDVLFSGNNIKSSATDNISEALSELNSITKFDDKYNSISKRIAELSYQMDDIVDEIRKERDNVDYNPDVLEQIEERIDLIFRLKKKYGSTIEEILEFRKKVEIELEEMVKSEEIVAELRTQYKNVSDELYETAKKINAARLKTSQILEGKIQDELSDLEMRKA